VARFLIEAVLTQNTPKNDIKQAFTAKIIADGQLWVDMLDCRNALSRNYDDAVFDKAVRGMADRFLHGPDEFYDFLKTECVTNSFGLTNSERALICGVLRPHPEVTAAKKFWRARQGQFAASFRH
jgi:hypothetical protein